MNIKYFFTSQITNHIEWRKSLISLFKALLLILIFTLPIFLLIRLLSEFKFFVADYVLSILIVCFSIFYILLKKDKLLITTLLFILTIWTGITIMASQSVGIRDITVIGYLILIFLATLFNGLRFSVLIAILSIISVWIMAIAEKNNVLIPSYDAPLIYARDFSFIILLSLAALMLFERSLRFSNQRIKKEMLEKIKAQESLLKNENELIKKNEALIESYERIKESEQKYRTLFENANIGIFQTSPEGVILNMNKALIQMLGYELIEEIENKNFLTDEWHFESKKNEITEFIEKQGNFKNHESCWKKKNGEVINILENVSAVYNNLGQILYFDVFVENITSRKKADLELKEREQNYREIFNSTSEAIFIHDAITGKILDVNDRMLQMYGYENKDEVLSATVNILSSGLDIYNESRALQNLKRTLTIGPQLFEWQAKKKNGEIFWAEVSLRSSQIGGIGRILAVVRNINDRKEFEIALAASEKKFREMNEMLPQTVFETDSYGIITFMNKTGLETLQLTEDDLKNGIDILSHICEEDRDRAAFNFVSTIKQFAVEGNQYTVLKKDGTKFSTQIYSNPFKTDNEIQGIRGIVVDLTERIKTEELIRINEIRLQKSQTLGHFGYSEGYLYTDQIWASAEAMKIFGFTPIDGYITTSQISACLIDILPFRKAYAELREQGKKFDLEFAINPADGSSPRFVHAISELEKESFGKPAKIVTTFQDITERINTSKSIKESEEKHRALMESMNEVIIMSDSNHIIHYVNKKFTEKLGYSPEEIIGKKGYPMLHDPEDLAIVEAENIKRINNVNSSYELTFKAKDGNKIDFLVSAAPYKNTDGISLGSIASLMDITERKKTEKALSESQQQFQTLAQMSPVGIFRTRADGYTTYVNPKWTELSGLSSEEALGYGWLKAVHHDEKEMLNKKWETDSKTGKNSISEYRFLKPDGSIVWVLGNALPEIVEGEIAGYIGTITDITEIKDAQVKIENSEKRFRELADLLPQTVWEANLSGIVTFLNKHGMELYGTNAEDVKKGINLMSCIIPEDIELASRSIQRRIKGEKVNFKDDEFTGVKKNGEKFPTKVYITIIKENGEAVGLRGITFDMTEIKKAEKDLKDSEARYRTIIEALTDMIMISDLNGNIIFMNDIAQSITGISPADYVNVKEKAQIHPEDYPLVLSAIKELIDGNKDFSGIIENRFIDLWGKIHWFSGTMAKIVLNGQTVIQTITRDITEKKLVEQELEKYRNDLEILVKERTDELQASNEELNSSVEELISQREQLELTLGNLKLAQKQLIQAEKMASLGVLAAGVAHEINNPLNFINGGVLGIESYLSENLHEHLNELNPLLNGIQEGVRRAAAIVTSLNHYSRQDDLPQTECDLHSILDNCLIMLQNQLKHRIVVHKNYTDKSHQLVGNEGKLHQAMLNILVNATQAIEDKGNIEITTTSENNLLKIIITDDGCGISKHNLAKIMDPFFTTKDPGKGTGLGLSITYNIIQEHKGTIEYQSQKHAGTTVTVRFPLT